MPEGVARKARSAITCVRQTASRGYSTAQYCGYAMETIEIPYLCSVGADSQVRRCARCTPASSGYLAYSYSQPSPTKLRTCDIIVHSYHRPSKNTILILQQLALILAACKPRFAPPDLSVFQEGTAPRNVLSFHIRRTTHR
jgi:hypothetical protein